MCFIHGSIIGVNPCPLSLPQGMFCRTLTHPISIKMFILCLKIKKQLILLQAQAYTLDPATGSQKSQAVAPCCPVISSLWPTVTRESRQSQRLYMPSCRGQTDGPLRLYLWAP